jgi:hypothetical protein
MKTKLLVCFFAMVMLLGFTTVSMADDIQNGDQVYIVDGIGDVGGGIFIVTDLNYKPLFESFCLELNEGLNHDPFTVHIDSYAVAGGTAGVVEVSPGVFGDPLSIGSAYLYFSFRNGTIPDFNKDDVGDVDALQYAFWVLEEAMIFDANNSIYPWASKVTDYIAFANSSDWKDIDGVAVLNLTNTLGENQQSMLTLVPEPMTLLLLGLGLLGLGITGRKLKK